MPNQPSAAVPVHYTPTRLLAGDELEAFRRLALTPIEQLTDRDIRDCSIPRLRAYISVYRARIPNQRALRVRQDYDRFFLAWFRYLYDCGEIQPRPALPVYLPAPGAVTPVTPATADHWSLQPHSPFTAHTDPGYLKLRPLNRPTARYHHPAPSPRGPHAWHAVFDAPTPPSAKAPAPRQPIPDAIIALLQQYGMFGRAWDKLGRDAVMLACDYLADSSPAPRHPAVAAEGVAEFLEELANITLTPLRRLSHTKDPFSVCDTLSSMPLIGNGVCTQLMRGDRSGVRRL